MHHGFLDRYSDLKSPLHSWDARLKTLSLIVAVICIASLPIGSFIPLIIYGAILLICWFVAKLPIIHLAKRLLLIFPFVLVISISMVFTKSDPAGSHPLITILYIMLRAGEAIIALTLMTATMSFPNLLGALSWMKVPNLLVALMSFIYSFIYIIIDEFERLSIARKSRELGNNLFIAWKSRAWQIGTFLIRSIERSDRVYNAMAARGYDGNVKSSNIGEPIKRDELVISILIILVLLFVRIGVTYR